MSEESRPIGGEIFTKPFKVLMAFALFAAVLVVIRLIYGLGAVTNLSDGYPWGIWITYDVVAGTAIACGGYAMAILVYVINKGEYHPLVRPALLASMFGYTLAGVSVMFDIGRYWQAYNLFLPNMLTRTRSCSKWPFASPFTLWCSGLNSFRPSLKV